MGACARFPELLDDQQRAELKTKLGVKNAIKKANSQIKKASQPCYGLVYLDVFAAQDRSGHFLE